MKIPINIKLDSTRIYSDLTSFMGTDHEPEVNSQHFTGFIKKTRDGFQIEYMEPEEHSVGETMTTINTFGGNVVSVNRIGQLSSHMVFEEGKCLTCIYDTGFFPMQMRVCTKELNNNLSMQGGKLNIDYSVEVVGSLAEKNRLSLSIYPDKSILTS